MTNHVDVLSLYDRSGIMVRPWLEAGFSTLTVDLEDARHYGPSLKVDLLATHDLPTCDVLFAFPPCTHLSSSGARWWAKKGPEALVEALAMVDVAKRAGRKSVMFMIENPIGRLSTYWRKPHWKFDPYEYAGLADDPESEAYTKRTCIWANFPKPPTDPVKPALGSKMHVMPPSRDRAYLRSITPSGFAKAVFLSIRNEI